MIARPIFASGFVEAAARFGIKTDVQVLTANEQKGREKIARDAGRRGGCRHGLGLADDVQADQRHGKAPGRTASATP